MITQTMVVAFLLGAVAAIVGIVLRGTYLMWRDNHPGSPTSKESDLSSAAVKPHVLKPPADPETHMHCETCGNRMEWHWMASGYDRKTGQKRVLVRRWECERIAMSVSLTGMSHTLQRDRHDTYDWELTPADFIPEKTMEVSG